MINSLQLLAVPGIPEVQPGDDVAAVIAAAMSLHKMSLEAGDVIAVAQKIISKAEGRYAYYRDVTASDQAIKLAVECDKDPRLVQLILDESVEVLRVRPGVIIVEHKQGYVQANAGIDKSNLPASNDERVLLLPEDSDASAQQLQRALSASEKVNCGVLINDSAGRAWRNGTLGFAIGTAGFNPLVNMIGKKDKHGREMEVTEVAVADELAAAASFVMGQADEAQPVVIIRGANVELGDFPSNVLIRAKNMDMFR